MENSRNYNLVINITRNDEILASAIYEHWGITYIAADMINGVVKCFDEIKEDYFLLTKETEITDWKLFAIMVLQEMDACLSDSAKEAAAHRWGDVEFYGCGNGKIEFETDGIEKNNKFFSVVAKMDIEAETVSFDEAIYEVDDEQEALHMAAIDKSNIDEDEISNIEEDKISDIDEDEEVADIIEKWCDSLMGYEGPTADISFDEWDEFFSMVDWSSGYGYFSMGGRPYGLFVDILEE